MEQIKITMPPAAEGQDGWVLHGGIWNNEPALLDKRTWIEKRIYDVMMFAHNKAEDFWHWIYYSSMRFAPPDVQRLNSYGEFAKAKVNHRYSFHIIENVVVAETQKQSNC